MTTLTPGANTGVASATLSVTVSYTPVTGADLDVSAFLLNESGKVRGDNDMCFFGQQSVNNGAVKLVESAAGRSVFSVNLDAIDPAIEKVALTATIYENKARFDATTHRYAQLREGIETGLVLVDGGGQGDFFDGLINGVQIDTEHTATCRRFHQLDRAIVDALLAEEAHVVVAAHLARLIEQERRHIQVCASHRGVADGDAQGATGYARIGAWSQGSHARTAWAASLARSCAVRPLATVPIAVRSQPAAVRLMYAMTTPV